VHFYPIEFVLCHFLALVQGRKEIIAHGGEALAAAEPYAALKMEEKTSEIQVDRADHAEAVIRHEHLRMDKTGGILEDPYAAFDKGSVVRPGDGMDIPFIGDVGSDDSYIQAVFSGQGERRQHLVVDDEIRSRDIEIASGFRDEVEIDIFAHRFLIERAIPKGLHETIRAKGRRSRYGGEIAGQGIVLPPSGMAPKLEEHEREAHHRFPFQHDGAVLPSAKATELVDVLVGEINASREAYPAVDHQNLPVIAMVVIG